MLYNTVCVEAISHVLPPIRVTSEMLEDWLKPLYERLHLPEGRLELMTGIRERRFWEPGTLPSEAAAAAGRKALDLARVLPRQVECLLHCAVSRDFTEPATATAVHRRLNLPGTALNFDVSNACLGVLSGILIVANMIELGQIQTGLVVTGENARPLIESVVRNLNADTSLNRQQIKPHFASLTIGSAAAAVLLTHESVSRTGHRLLGGASFANTHFNHLCQGHVNGGMTDQHSAHMHTDAEELLVQGIEVARHTWDMTCDELAWNSGTPDVLCTHQVGRVHSRTLFEQLKLDPTRSLSTFETLGNCGSASLPLTVSMAEESGKLTPGAHLAMLGIGSGINCTMLGVRW